MGINKNEMQELIFKTMCELAKSKHKIVFKGSVLLSLLMNSVNIVTPSRLSRDFDGDLQIPVKINEIYEEIIHALNTVGVNYTNVEIDKRTSDTQFFFSVVSNENGFPVVLFNIDLGICVNPWHTTYQLSNGTVLYGQTLEKIFYDKICVISSKDVIRRPWDIFDMYLLSLRSDLYMSKILAVKNGTDRPIGDWQDFLYPSDKLKSTWRRHRYIKNRPEFNIMYARVRDLCTPFMLEGSSEIATWNPEMGLWYDGEESDSNNEFTLSSFS